MQPVRHVVAAQHGPQPRRAIFRLEAGHLALDQGFRRAARRGHFDRDGVTDRGVELSQDVAVRIMERDREHVWKVLMMIDDDLF